MTITSTQPAVAALRDALIDRTARGERFAGLSAARDGATVTLSAYVAAPGRVDTLEAALPPSGIFRSEFQIVAGGLDSGNYAAAAVLVVLVTVAFFGLTTASTRVLFTRAPRSLSAAAVGPSDRGEPSAWMVIPAVAGVAALFLLGLHPPAELTALISRAVTELGAAR